LGERAGIAQEVISRHENPGYSGLTLRTALRLAAALKVGLVMRFVPYSDVVDWAVNSTADDFLVPTLEQDTRLDDPYPAPQLLLLQGNVDSCQQSDQAGLRQYLNAEQPTSRRQSPDKLEQSPALPNAMAIA
jgi:hypothetical protein